MSAQHLEGQLSVMRGLLTECAGVIGTIEAESSDEARRLAVLLDQIRAAVAPQDGVGIDAIHFRLT